MNTEQTSKNIFTYKYYPQTFLDELFETHNDSNINNLFKELVQIIDWSDDESNN